MSDSAAARSAELEKILNELRSLGGGGRIGVDRLARAVVDQLALVQEGVAAVAAVIRPGFGPVPSPDALDLVWGPLEEQVARLMALRQRLTWEQLGLGAGPGPFKDIQESIARLSELKSRSEARVIRVAAEVAKDYVENLGKELDKLHSELSGASTTIDGYAASLRTEFETLCSQASDVQKKSAGFLRRTTKEYDEIWAKLSGPLGKLVKVDTALAPDGHDPSEAPSEGGIVKGIEKAEALLKRLKEQTLRHGEVRTTCEKVKAAATSAIEAITNWQVAEFEKCAKPFLERVGQMRELVAKLKA